MTAIPDDPNALLTRDRLSEALTEAGYTIASPTLATKASRGGGPVYRLFNGRAVYRWGDGLQWAVSKLSAPRRSTSESDIQEIGDAGTMMPRARPMPPPRSAMRGVKAIPSDTGGGQ